jgi:hypothetical protein
MAWIALLCFVIVGCSHTFKATLVPDGQPQDVKCTLKPDTDLPQLPKTANLNSDLQIFKSDLMAFLYNPALSMTCNH